MSGLAHRFNPAFCAKCGPDGCQYDDDGNLKGSIPEWMATCECGSHDFQVQVKFVGTVDISCDDAGSFEVTDSEPGDSEWNNDSEVICTDCKRTYTVGQLFK